MDFLINFKKLKFSQVIFNNSSKTANRIAKLCVNYGKVVNIIKTI